MVCWESAEKGVFPFKAISPQRIIWIMYEITMRLPWKCSRVKEWYLIFSFWVIHLKCSKGRTAQGHYLPVSDFKERPQYKGLIQSFYKFHQNSKMAFLMSRTVLLTLNNSAKGEKWGRVFLRSDASLRASPERAGEPTVRSRLSPQAYKLALLRQPNTPRSPL